MKFLHVAFCPCGDQLLSPKTKTDCEKNAKFLPTYCACSSGSHGIITLFDCEVMPTVRCFRVCVCVLSTPAGGSLVETKQNSGKTKRAANGLNLYKRTNKRYSN